MNPPSPAGLWRHEPAHPRSCGRGWGWPGAAGLLLLLLPQLATRTVAAPAPAPATANDDWTVFPHAALLDLPNVLPPSPTLLQSLGNAAEVVARRTAPSTAAVWRRRRPEVQTALRRSLGLDPWPDRTPLHARITATNLFADCSIENVVFESRPGLPITANFYRPNSPARRAGKKFPAVLSPIGHFLSAGKTAVDVQARCLQLARLGFGVLAYDALGQGERMTPGNIHHDAGYALLPTGETIAGWMVWDSIRALDYLESRADVDSRRIGLTGNSGGGLNTLLTAALDERIQCAVIVGFTFEFGNWLKFGGAHCTCTHWPGAFQDFRWSEVAGLIAPRAVMMLQGGNDGIFPISGARTSGQEVEALYAALGHRERARFVELPSLPHAYSRPFRETMAGWMTLHLQGQGHGDPVPEGPLDPLPEKDARLLCDPDRDFMSRAPTVVELARRRGLQQVTRLSAMRTVGPVDLGADSLAVAHRWARDLTAAPPPGSQLLAPRSHRRDVVANGTLERVSFTSEGGVRLPALLWMPSNLTTRAPAVIVTDRRGKSAVAASRLPDQLLAAGYAVLALDLRGRGETLDRYGPNYDINFRLVANQVLMGQPLAGRRGFDLLRAVDFLAGRTNIDAAAITVVGLGDDALPALLAAAAEPRIRHVAVAGFVRTLVALQRARTPPPLPQMGDAWNDPQLRGRIDTGDDEIDFGSVLPGALTRADVADLAALVAPRRLLICQARDLGQAGLEPATERLRGVATLQPSFSYRPERDLNTELIPWLQHNSSR